MNASTINTVLNKNNSSKNKHLEREILYTLMNSENMEKLSELNPDKLLLFLKTDEINGRISFKYYAEFLNILNSIISSLGIFSVHVDVVSI